MTEWWNCMGMVGHIGCVFLLTVTVPELVGAVVARIFTGEWKWLDLEGLPICVLGLVCIILVAISSFLVVGIAVALYCLLCPSCGGLF